MDPFALILASYLRVALCMGIDHPEPNPPTVMYVEADRLRCSFGKCSGKYALPPRRKIKIAAGRASAALLQHELVHDLLQQRDGKPDRAHRDPAFVDCVGLDVP